MQCLQTDVIMPSSSSLGSDFLVASLPALKFDFPQDGRPGA